MTKFHIRPSSVQGTIIIPPSKSHTLRAILFASMANGDSEIRDFLHSPDATAMIDQEAVVWHGPPFQRYNILLSATIRDF